MSGYSPVGDLSVLSIGFVIIILLFFSSVHKNRSYRIFTSIVAVLMASAATDVLSYTLTQSSSPAAPFVRCVFHAFLFFLFVLFSLYICEAARLKRKTSRIFLTISVVFYIAVIGADIWASATSHVPEEQYIYICGYCAFFILMIVMLIVVRHRLYSKVMYGFYGAITVSFVILMIQGILYNSSYTVVTFFLPVLALFYSMHSNPYDVQLGAADATAFAEYIKQVQSHGQSFIYMSFYLRLFQEDGFIIPDALQAAIRHYSSVSFKNSHLFQPERGHLILTAVKEQNPDYEKKIQAALENFQKEYEKYHFDFKLLIGESADEIGGSDGYLTFFQNMRDRIEENTIRFVNVEDVRKYPHDVRIQKVLEDIYKKCDLDDPRVLVYCQPVYDVKTGTFHNAEALMRLQLEDEIIQPNDFIPIAEKNGYIHVLTQIILHKTCDAIRYYCENGYNLSSISVNVSALELREESFTQDIMRIIYDSGVPGDKIAIEMTESQTYSDFLLMKKMIIELKEKGMAFCLDDFGTGYSNMERILEIPFDVIKFDRSLVQTSRKDPRSRKLIEGISNTFSSMDYKVLYEGIEEEADEKMCKEMSACYLQGYKFARPVPIMVLGEYLSMDDKDDKGTVPLSSVNCTA